MRDAGKGMEFHGLPAGVQMEIFPCSCALCRGTLYIQHAIRFEWDEAKAAKNLTKHGIDFATATLIFDDPFVYRYVERILDGEQRWHAYGIVFGPQS